MNQYRVPRAAPRNLMSLLLPQIVQGMFAWLHEHGKGLVEVIGSGAAMTRHRVPIPDPGSISVEDRAMPFFRMLVVLSALAVSGAAFADTDCTDPISSWKPREMLRQEVEQRGWTVQRIKVDDGCYQVRGTDRKGNRIKAKYSPASLKIRSLEVEFGPDADASEYFAPVRQETERRRNAPIGKGHVP